MPKVKVIIPTDIERNLELVHRALNNLPKLYNLPGLATLAGVGLNVACNVRQGLTAHPTKVAALANALIQIGVFEVDEDGCLEMANEAKEGAA